LRDADAEAAPLAPLPGGTPAASRRATTAAWPHHAAMSNGVKPWAKKENDTSAEEVKMSACDVGNRSSFLSHAHLFCAARGRCSCFEECAGSVCVPLRRGQQQRRHAAGVGRVGVRACSQKQAHRSGVAAASGEHQRPCAAA
jgi:hypothetical protein